MSHTLLSNTAPELKHCATPSLGLCDVSSSQRPEIESFIDQRYAQTYGAKVEHFLPFLMTSYGAGGVEAVLGLRPGSLDNFFVETYLDRPIEQYVFDANGSNVPRARCIETGNLAGSRGNSQLLFIVLTSVLYRAGFHWVTFTATAQVSALLQRLGFAPKTICEALPSRLEDKGHSWGTYYANNPCVVIGDVRQAHATLMKNEYATYVLLQHRHAIDAIVHQLSAYTSEVA
ncbi:MAG: thermostable hemolysin [Pseudohongiellaceae bacterium]|nr:thermostable hemolysin [Pseudohongiellaceae bacterium]